MAQQSCYVTALAVTGLLTSILMQAVEKKDATGKVTKAAAKKK